MSLSLQQFTLLKRAEMLATLKAEGLGRGLSKANKATLVQAYGQWLDGLASPKAPAGPVSQFRALTRADMLRRLKAIGRAKGLSRAKKAVLVDAYATWQSEMAALEPDVVSSPLSIQDLDELASQLDDEQYRNEVIQLRASIALDAVKTVRSELAECMPQLAQQLQQLIDEDDPTPEAVHRTLRATIAALKNDSSDHTAERTRALAVLCPAREELAQALGELALKSIPPPGSVSVVKQCPLTKPSEAPVVAEPGEVETGAPLQPVRAEQDSPVELEVDIGFATESNFYTGLSADLSTGGIFIATYILLPIDTCVTVSFVLPTGHRVSTDGRVAWIRESTDLISELQPGIGVAFTALDPEDHTEITKFTCERDPIFYES